ncbi:hypothetical protein DL95DRAFT_522056 [Leptodontidium sp. 2 PMI_412]|nr:hypothetical protein BKA61DRAFT_727592 [Leptodontidium sp. MPI-SDFR-AT-0119]KAH9217369.1 hypothetical protein DL95DRAFT_522056 [Leptodontidium sp. 2 PMI_412]
MSSQSVLLIGASGWVGPYFSAEFLQQKDKFARLAILSDASKVSKFAKEAAAGIEIVVGSYLEPASFKGSTTVICMLGNEPMKLQPHIIDAAIAGGVTHFYPSEFGSDLSHPVALTQRYFRDKQATRRHLEQTAQKHNTFGYTYIMNGGFAEFAAHPAFGFNQAEKKFEFWGDTKIRQPVSGWNEIVAIISRIEGVEYQIIHHPNDEAYAQAAMFANEGDVFQELMWSLKAFLGDPKADPVPKPWDVDQFPEIEPEGLEASLKRYLEAKK